MENFIQANQKIFLLGVCDIGVELILIVGWSSSFNPVALELGYYPFDEDGKGLIDDLRYFYFPSLFELNRVDFNRSSQRFFIDPKQSPFRLAEITLGTYSNAKLVNQCPS